HELARDRDVLARQREALALLNSPDAKRLELAGSQTAQNARGSFVYDQKTGKAVFVAEGLPATPPDKAYELWFIPKGHSPVPGRIFTVDPSGHALLPEQMPADAMQNVRSEEHTSELQSLRHLVCRLLLEKKKKKKKKKLL